MVVGFGSAVLPIINIEAYLGALGAVATSTTAMVVAISAAAAVGQTIGKVVLYYAAEWAMRLPWIRRKTSTPSSSEVRALADPDRRAPRPDRGDPVRLRDARLPAAARDRGAGRPAAGQHLAVRVHLRHRPLPPVPRAPRRRRLARALMEVREITPGDSADLRREVLRGGRDVPLPGDESPAFHVGVYDGPSWSRPATCARNLPPGRPTSRAGGSAAWPPTRDTAERVRGHSCWTPWSPTPPRRARSGLVQRPHSGPGVLRAQRLGDPRRRVGRPGDRAARRHVVASQR